MSALLIFVVTLTLVLWQPRRIGIGWLALAGAAAALLSGVVSLSDLAAVWHIVWDATLTFAALIVISILLDEAGFFHWAALHVMRRAGGDAHRLFPMLMLLGALIAALFANDGAALLLTPIMLAILRRVGFKPATALAFVIGTGFIADTTSLPLIVSNLVNIISANYFSIPFDRYASVMIPVDLVALVASLGMLWLYFRRHLPARYALERLPDPRSAISDPLVFRAGFPLLGSLLGAYFLTAQQGIPVSLVTGIAATLLLALAGRWHRGGTGARIDTRRALRQAPWQIVTFSLGMYVVVYGLRNAGLTGWVAQALPLLAGHGPALAAVGTGFLAAGLSSVMNNLPATLVGALAIDQSHGISTSMREVLIYANVIGCDLGTKFTPIGSLATLLWMHRLARDNAHISWWRYIKTGLVLTPPVLLASLLALAGWLTVIGPAYS